MKTAAPTHPRMAHPVRKAFELLGVGPTRGYQFIAQNLLTTYVVGGRRYCSQQAVEDCLTLLEQGKGAGSAKKAA